MASYGGSYNENLQKAWISPFQRETSIKVTLGENASLALLKAQVQAGSGLWDIIELTGSEYEVASKQGLLEAYDYNAIDASRIAAFAKKPYGIKYALYIFVMAWDRNKIPDDQAPTTWKEFWDTQRYHTKRSLLAQMSVGTILEAALLADGVALDKVYPIDVDKALRSLDKLGWQNIIWHNTNQEPIQQLTSGEVALASSWNGRVIPAQRSGANIGYTPNQGLVSGDYLGIVKGAPHKDAAMKLVNYMVSNAQGSAEFMKLTGYATPNSDALKLLPAEIADKLPTSEKLSGKVLVGDDNWWLNSLDNVNTKFKEWQLAH
jgi:putative spermidine/putrescine transport system substrate-binding protein